jgi:hypothetical protein
MSEFRLTPFADVNAVLSDFHTRITALCGSQFIGMYVIGSLALGDFDPDHSDIDFVVVTEADIDDTLFGGLQDIHARFAASSSPWAKRIEAVYITENALRDTRASNIQYPQIEKGTALFKAPLEDGWVFQLQTLRDYALVVSGGDLHTLIDPISHEEMRPAVQAISGMWLEQSRHDPKWLDWVRERHNQVFVIQTLCRMLYSLETGDVISKPRAVQWGQTHLSYPCAALIAASVSRRHEEEQISPDELNDTLAFIKYTVERSQGER